MEELLEKCEDLFKNLSKKLNKEVTGKVIDISKISPDKFGVQIYVNDKEMKILLIKDVIDNLHEYNNIDAINELEILILEEIQNE